MTKTQSATKIASGDSKQRSGAARNAPHVHARLGDGDPEVFFYRGNCKFEWTVSELCLPSKHDFCTFVVIVVEANKHTFFVSSLIYSLIRFDAARVKDV